MSDPNVAGGPATPVVDVVIPTRNRWELTRDAIESVRAQTYTGWRLVIVDDASDDGSVEQLSAFVAGDDRVTLVRQPSPGGSNAARQAGFAASTAPLVASLDSDDLWRPTKLERQVALLRDSPDASLVLCWHDHVRMDDGHRSGVHRSAVDGRANPIASYNMSTPLFTRAALDAAGGFTPPGTPWLPTTEHVDLFVRVTRSASAAVVPEVLVDCRHHRGERNSDGYGTAQAAAEAATLLTTLQPHLEGRPRIRAWLTAWVGVRYLVVGDRRRGLSYLRAACAAADARTAARILRTYGPFTAQQLVRSATRRGAHRGAS